MCNQVTYGKVRRVAMLLLMTLAFALQSQQAMADTPRVDDPRRSMAAIWIKIPNFSFLFCPFP